MDAERLRALVILSLSEHRDRRVQAGGDDLLGPVGVGDHRSHRPFVADTRPA
jgi:hypothetical protein